MQIGEGDLAATGLHAQGHHLSPSEASVYWLLPDMVEYAP